MRYKRRIQVFNCWKYRDYDGWVFHLIKVFVNKFQVKVVLLNFGFVVFTRYPHNEPCDHTKINKK